jgi:hypothetical protein
MKRIFLSLAVLAGLSGLTSPAAADWTDVSNRELQVDLVYQNTDHVNDLSALQVSLGVKSH